MVELYISNWTMNTIPTSLFDMKTRLADWLATYDSGQTVKNHRSAITAFLRNVYGDGDIEVLAERCLADEGRDHSQYLTSFFVSLKDKAPKSQSLMLGAVHVFLSEYGIELFQRLWRRFRRRRKQLSKAASQSIGTQRALL